MRPLRRPPKRLLSRLSAFERAERLFEPGDKVLAAVSGGPDSVCLAHHLCRLAPRKRLRVELLHMHHGLRGADADDDQRSVERLAARLGVPLHLSRLPVERTAREERRCLEDAGRRLRYAELARTARRLGFNKAATGHQLDDQAETFLLHLLRGTKAKGLSGIPPKRPLAPGCVLVRPLLALSRKDVREYLDACGLRWREDPSNRSERFTRNWVRRRALPLLEKKNPRIREHLASLAADLRRVLPKK